MVPRDEVTARLAAALITNYGDEAAVAASERAEAMEKIGNSQVAEIWAAVTKILEGGHGQARRGDA